MKGKLVKSETMTHMLTLSVDKGGQETNRSQEEGLRIITSDDRHVTYRRKKDNLEAENRESDTYQPSRPEISGVGRKQLPFEWTGGGAVFSGESQVGLQGEQVEGTFQKKVEAAGKLTERDQDGEVRTVRAQKVARGL